MAIFLDMVEKFLKAFMDDLSIFKESFNPRLANLEKVLQCCVETKLMLNWEKCHFMVKEGILLRHKMSNQGIEVDHANIETNENLPPPSSIKGIQSFLRHTYFYRRFIKNFS